jgi:hypothetical protein
VGGGGNAQTFDTGFGQIQIKTPETLVPTLGSISAVGMLSLGKKDSNTIPLLIITLKKSDGYSNFQNAVSTAKIMTPLNERDLTTNDNHKMYWNIIQAYGFKQYEGIIDYENDRGLFVDIKGYSDTLDPLTGKSFPGFSENEYLDIFKSFTFVGSSSKSQSTPAQSAQPAETNQVSSGVELNPAQSQDAECLATTLMSEASIGTNEERTAVAWTIFNRVSSPNFPNTICEVTHQPNQYATNQAPTQEILDLAESLIANPGTDPTGGATYFFSPRGMPMEGGDTTRYDVGGGLHDVAGIDKKVYFPSWTLTKEYVGDLQGIRPAYYMFYRESVNAVVPAAVPGASIGFPVTLTLYVHDRSASGPIIPGALVTGRDAAGNSFQQATDSSGYVAINGNPGTWHFEVSAEGYQTNIWDQEIAETDTKDAFLQKSVASTTQSSETSREKTPSTPINYYSGVAVRSRDRQAWPFKLTLIGPYTDGSLSGQIEWTTLNAIHLIKGSKTATGITFAETAYIKRGNALLGCKYYLNSAGGNSFAGTWDSCGEGSYGDITVNPL